MAIHELSSGFSTRHLLGIEGLQPKEITYLLDRADEFVDHGRRANKKLDSMRGLTQINLFFESSTRTRTSFELAGKRLGADVVNMTVASSSIKKGETLIDTAMTLNAMHPDVLVARHHDSGAVSLLARHVNCAVINAGDGSHEHPTQALLDALTIRRRRGRIEGLLVVICGDILHSRVARSNIILLTAMGARVRVVAPKTLLPASVEAYGVEVCHDMKTGLQDADIVMMLRLQTERMQGSFVPSVREYFHMFGLTYEKLSAAKDDAMIMHPGPMNRGVEIDGTVADDIHRSAILDQVELGVAVRMACLDVLTEGVAGCRMSERLLIRNARLLDPASRLDQTGSLLIEDRLIADFGPLPLTDDEHIDAEVIDAKGLCLAPGLVDMRVLFGEPGAEHKETFESGTLAAAAGGVTSLACLPNTEPAIDDPAMVEFIARRARQQKRVKVHPYGAVTQRCEGKQLAEMGLLQLAGAVGFTDGHRPIKDSLVMRRAMAYVSALGGRIMQYPEDPALIGAGVMNEGEIATRLGLAAIPYEAEVIMVERDCRLCEATGCAYHVGPISTRPAVNTIRRAKAKGLPVTASVAPTHLVLNELAVEGYRTFAKVKPPLRAEEDRLAVIEGLVDGTIDVIVSDHCPQDQDSKRLPFAQAEFGAVGLETLLPVSLSLVHEGHLGLLDFLDKVTRTPAALLGLEAGCLERGAPADIILFDPDAPRRLRADDLVSLSKNTPFEGRLLQGRVIRTMVDGRTIFQDAFLTG